MVVARGTAINHRPNVSEPRSAQASLFRRKTVEAVATRAVGDGDVLRLSPSWIRWTFPTLAVLVIAAGVASIVVPFDEWASGPAFVQQTNTRELATFLDGVVESIHADPGQRVIAGDVLIRLYDDGESQLVDRLDEEFESQLVRLLSNPADQAARVRVATLQGELREARAESEQRLVRAPADGVVQDVRVRPGQRVDAGDLLVSFASRDKELEVLALLPGTYRPVLAEGQAMHLRLDGYAHGEIALPVGQVSPEAIGPAAAARLLPPELADAVSLRGPTVIVRGGLAIRNFKAGNDDLELYGGMTGLAEVRVRRRPLILALVPSLDDAIQRIRGSSASGQAASASDGSLTEAS